MSYINSITQLVSKTISRMKIRFDNLIQRSRVANDNNVSLKSAEEIRIDNLRMIKLIWDLKSKALRKELNQNSAEIKAFQISQNTTLNEDHNNE